jgi:AAA+ superfamily predicted ATPase
VASLAVRDARLLGAGVVFSGWEAAASSDAVLREIAAALDAHRDLPHPVFLDGRAASPDVSVDRADLHYVVEAPSHAQRTRLWSEQGSPDEAARLASSFKLGVNEIRAASRMAASLARLRGRDVAGLAELQAAARLQTRPRLSTLAQKLTPRFTWEDIVLSEDRVEQLREIVAQATHKHTVYEEWGLGEKLTLGRGIAALFAGPSGTGKTMAAELIAGELGLDMYKIDLSGLVSKYIGETEKNLARVFDEAGDSDAVLFFDEADAVFGKRSEVRDSHDRYANIEVGYLLQRLEEHDGIVVLATNLRANIDDAFLRRMRSVIEFPFPEEDDRRRIWERSIAGAPLQDDVDLGFMAGEYRVSGGNIRNIVLLGAFLAASAGETIGMSHLVRAANREYQKLGRLASAAKQEPAGRMRDARPARLNSSIAQPK